MKQERVLVAEGLAAVALDVDAAGGADEGRQDQRADAPGFEEGAVGAVELRHALVARGELRREVVALDGVVRRPDEVRGHLGLHVRDGFQRAARVAVEVRLEIRAAVLRRHGQEGQRPAVRVGARHVVEAIDVLDGRARARESRRGGLERARRRVAALALGREPVSGDAERDAGEAVGRRDGRLAVDDGVQQRHVRHGRAHGPGRVAERRDGHDAGPGPARRPEADDAAERRRAAQRTAGVGPEPAGRHARGDRRRGARRGAAAVVGRVPRVQARAVDGRLAREADGHLRHVRFCQRDRARREELLDAGRGRRRPPFREARRARRRQRARDVYVDLDHDGQPLERAQVAAGFDLCVDGRGLGQRRLPEHLDAGPEVVPFHEVDALQRGRDDVYTSLLARFDGAHELGRGWREARRLPCYRRRTGAGAHRGRPIL